MGMSGAGGVLVKQLQPIDFYFSCFITVALPKRGRETPRRSSKPKRRLRKKPKQKQHIKKTKRTKWNFSNVLEANCVKPETENVSARQIESVSKLKLLLGFNPREKETDQQPPQCVRARLASVCRHIKHEQHLYPHHHHWHYQP